MGRKDSSTITVRFGGGSKSKKLILGAQIQAIGFYEKLGYQVYGGEYLDANIPHKDMEKIL